MENTFTPKELACYANFGAQYRQARQDIVGSITQHALSLYAYEAVSQLPGGLESLLSALEQYYNAVAQVCKKPYTHLKMAREVVRLDKVKKIGYEAVSYLASHPEDWQQKSAVGLKPARLLSITKEIDYGVYENKVTKKLLDEVIVLLTVQQNSLKQKQGQLQEVAGGELNYDSNPIFGWDFEFSQALKEMFSLDSAKVEANTVILGQVTDYVRRIELLLKKYRRLRSGPLYRQAGDVKNISRQIHKTNLFCFHKQYNAVLKLWGEIKEFNAVQSVGQNAWGIEDSQKDFLQNYLYFCYCVLVYALNKMGFEKNGAVWTRRDFISVNVRIEGTEVLVTLEDTTPYRLAWRGPLNWPQQDDGSFYREGGYLTWKVNTSSAQIGRFISANQHIPANRDLHGKINQVQNQGRVRKTIRLVPYAFPVREDEVGVRQKINTAVSDQADLTLFVFPLSENGEQRLTQYVIPGHRFAAVPLSLFDVNSYRRIQKIFWSILGRWRISEDCPLCGQRLGGEENNVRRCNTCKINITRTRCIHGHEYVYWYYDIADNYRVAQQDSSFLARDSRFRYVDITPLVIEGHSIRPCCPHCNFENTP